MKHAVLKLEHCSQSILLHYMCNSGREGEGREKEGVRREVEGRKAEEGEGRKGEERG